jgi:putative peptidoglycan lipid II flippase
MSTSGKRSRRKARRRLAGLVFRVLFISVSLISVVGMIFAEELVGFYAGHYRLVPGKFELTVTMTRILFPFFPLVALAAAYMGVLNSLGKFFLPGFASALFNLTSIAVGVCGAWIAPRFGFEPILGMAWGVVAGGAVQAFCQLPELLRQGYRYPRYRADIDLPWHQNEGLRRILILMVPGMVGMAATQINVLINSILATSQGTGAVSWLNYAFRLMQFPIGVFGVSLSAATLPVLSALRVEKKWDEIEKTLQQSLSQVFAINFPAAAGLAALGVPIIALLFQYGRFSDSDTASTARALAAYSVGLAAYSGVKVLVPACYALGRTQIAVASSVLSVALTLAFNLMLVDSLGFAGLALGTSAAAIFNFVFLLVAVRGALVSQGGRFLLSPLLSSLLKSFWVSAAMGLICWKGVERSRVGGAK